MTSPRWTLVLPLKGGAAAKSRLGGPAELATGIALDCLAAALAAPGVAVVVVVTPDEGLAARARAAGAQVRPESAPGTGLLAALRDGLSGLQGWTAVLLADLPALRPGDLAAALEQAAERLRRPGAAPMVFVPDAETTGTVLLCARTTGAIVPAFGPGSAGAHEAGGALRLDLDLPRLRRDVDTPADLRAALALGVGPLTRAALQALQPLEGLDGP